MEQQQYENIVLRRPACRVWQDTETEKRKAVAEALKLSLTKICRSSEEFMFTWGRDTVSSVADQSEYLLTGADSDARSIVNVRFGITENLLAKKTVIERDDYLSGRARPTTVAFWTPIEEQGGFPLIELVGTPAGFESIQYRYVKKTVRMPEFPDGYRDVLVAMAESQLFGTVGVVVQNVHYIRTTDPLHFDRRAEKELSDMIDAYETSSGQEDAAPFSKSYRATNRRRNALRGL